MRGQLLRTRQLLPHAGHLCQQAAAIHGLQPLGLGLPLLLGQLVRGGLNRLVKHGLNFRQVNCGGRRLPLRLRIG